MSETLTLTNEMLLVFGILLITVCLFVSEVVRVDVAALSVLVLIGLTALIPGYAGLVDSTALFSGFSSNAVISIMAVMVIGAGLDRTGFMGQLAAKILKFGGRTEGRMIALLSSVVGLISSFMQNIGAAALFLPVVNRIARRGNLAISRLLMPMGFCAILGGTVTMIGSSPLILLNDLISNSNKTLPQGVSEMDAFGLFAVTPIGLILLCVGIVYFVFLGRFVLPVVKDKPGESGSMLRYFKEVYGIEGEVYECRVTKNSPLIGRLLSDVDAAGRAGWIIAVRTGNELVVAPRGDTEFWAGTELAIMGRREAVEGFTKSYALDIKNEMDVFADTLNASSAGISEVVIPPDSALIGKTLRDAGLRKRYGATVLAVFRADDVHDTDIIDMKIQSGDTLVIHSSWSDLGPLADNRNDYVVVTDFPRSDERPEKTKFAGLCFAVTLGLVLFSDMRLSIALMTGALGMILFGVIKIDEAYRAISWQSVFLLAGLLPLGIAVENSGTAAWVAAQVLAHSDGASIWMLQAALAVLATVFTLLMSNIGATVLLVPLAVNIALHVGGNPAVFALTVALATSNSFLIPTHQVNALIMGPGGYQVSDFIKAGGMMTLLFLVVVVGMLSLLFN